MNTVVQTLSDLTLRQFLEDGVQLKDILRNSTSLSVFIKDNLKGNQKLSDQQIDNAINNLYHSSLNIIQLVNLFKNNKFKYTQDQYACNLDALKELLLFKQKNSLNYELNEDSQNSQTIKLLCELSNQGHLDDLLQLTQKSIDLVKVLNWIRTLMLMLKLNEQHLHLNNVMQMLTTVEQHDLLASNHQWNASDQLQYRINTIVHHIDHNKNGFVISLERLTQKHTIDSLIATISEIELQLASENQQLAQSLKTITIGLKSLEYFKNQGLFEVKCKCNLM